MRVGVRSPAFDEFQRGFRLFVCNQQARRHNILLLLQTRRQVQGALAGSCMPSLCCFNVSNRESETRLIVKHLLHEERLPCLRQ